MVYNLEDAVKIRLQSAFTTAFRFDCHGLYSHDDGRGPVPLP